MVIGSLHPHQLEIFLDPSRIRVLACGARWGKDRLTIFDLLIKTQYMAQVEQERRKGLIPPVLAWYVAPTYGLLRQAWEELEYFVREIKGAKLNRSSLRCWLPGGIEIEFKSADNPSSLLSRGLDYVAITECARIPQEAWERSILTRLSSPGRGIAGKGGMALLNSTPEGQNWYYRLWQRGQSDKTGYIKSWQFSTYDNPYIDASEIDRHKNLLPERVFRQEYLAEFVSGAGSVFHKVANSYEVYSLEQAEQPGCDYTAGIDWGRHNDATVLTVLKSDPWTGCYTVADWLRMTNKDFSEQLEAISSVLANYPSATVIPEANSMGDPLIEQLRQHITNDIKPFTTTNTSKKQIIEGLALAFEQGTIKLPAVNQHDVLVPLIQELSDELGSYTCTSSKSGVLTYNAPAGLHDDTVISLALAYMGRQSQTTGYFKVSKKQ